MKTEMDLLDLDKRHREAWLKANRSTLIIVGLVWLGLIAWELTHDRTPWFLIAMVPVIAALRWGFYRRYLHR